MRIFLEFNQQPLWFDSPVYLIDCVNPRELPEAFAAMEKALQDGLTLAGFLSYEAGEAFEKTLQRDLRQGFPLLLFGAYREARVVVPDLPTDPPARLGELVPALSRELYGRDIAAIHRAIAAGEVYQITYCLKHRFEFDGSPWNAYRRLWAEQPVPYPAYIDAGDFQIASLSPELFMRKTGKHLVTQPMKGTWPRARGWLGDQWARWRFQFDSKNRAENVMIADLLRNDLGRIGGDVCAPKLFEVTRYRTLFQMTSTVTAAVDANVSLYNLFASLFPSGSVTGAPKIRAMEIIRELEDEPRHIYTGAIGMITPQKDLCFSVPIRTLLLRGGRGEIGVGGGIIWDSTADGEWAEGQLKLEFLRTLTCQKT